MNIHQRIKVTIKKGIAVTKITNAVLAEKIDSLHLAVIEIKTDVKENTKFRLQARGMIVAFSFVWGALGSVITFIATRYIG